MTKRLEQDKKEFIKGVGKHTIKNTDEEFQKAIGTN